MLKIISPVDITNTGPKNFTINVRSSFRNPYSGKPKRGYVLSTRDENGNVID